MPHVRVCVPRRELRHDRHPCRSTRRRKQVAPRDMALNVGTRLGHSNVTSLLGEGGMGQVWQATDTQLNRQVALKILPDAFAADPDRLARFTREAQILGRSRRGSTGTGGCRPQRGLFCSRLPGQDEKRHPRIPPCCAGGSHRGTGRSRGGHHDRGSHCGHSRRRLGSVVRRGGGGSDPAVAVRAGAAQSNTRSGAGNHQRHIFVVLAVRVERSRDARCHRSIGPSNALIATQDLTVSR